MALIGRAGILSRSSTKRSSDWVPSPRSKWREDSNGPQRDDVDPRASRAKVAAASSPRSPTSLSSSLFVSFLCSSPNCPSADPELIAVSDRLFPVEVDFQ